MGSIYGVSTRQSTSTVVTLVTIKEGGWGSQNETTGGSQNETQTFSKRINTPLPPTIGVQAGRTSQPATVTPAAGTRGQGGNHPGRTCYC